MIMVLNDLCYHGDISEDHGSAGNTFDDGNTGGDDDIDIYIYIDDT